MFLLKKKERKICWRIFDSKIVLTSWAGIRVCPAHYHVLHAFEIGIVASDANDGDVSDTDVVSIDVSHVAAESPEAPSPKVFADWVTVVSPGDVEGLVSDWFKWDRAVRVSSGWIFSATFIGLELDVNRKAVTLGSRLDPSGIWDQL